jgi:Tfp pilus assembly pilus retraction ATPase PilT
LAAVVEEINRRDRRHIITIEDPIEYEHQHHGSVVEQVEIGIDAPDFPTALRAALRQATRGRPSAIVAEARRPGTLDGYDRRQVPPTESR